MPRYRGDLAISNRVMREQLNKFSLLLWKNWKLQYRRSLQTTVEIAAPIIFSILLVVVRSLVDPEKSSEHKFSPFHPAPLNFFSPKNTNSTNGTNSLQRYLLVYSPSPNTILDRSMNILRSSFSDVRGYKNAKELEAHFLTDEGPTTLAGIQFDDDLYNKDYIPPDIEVSLRFPGELRDLGGDLFSTPAKHNGTVTLNNTAKDSKSVVGKLDKLFYIRNWKTHMLYPVFETPGPRERERNNGAYPSYYKEGFLGLQTVITFALILGELGIDSIVNVPLKLGTAPPIIHMQRFPHASWKEDPLLPALIGFIGLIIMLSFVYTCINTVKAITTEKEKQLKEAMKIMGLPNWLHWIAWFIKYFIYLLISVIFIVLLLTVTWYPESDYSIFTHANPLILFTFLMFYVCATITFCFAISVFFSKANTAATVAGLMWFLSYTPYMFLHTQYDQLSLTTKLISSLGSNTAMAYGFQLFLMYEGTSEGIQWHNVNKPIAPGDTLTLSLILLMLVVDAFIYLIIALYVEAVFPGDYGMPQPWYFPFTYSFWCGRPVRFGLADAEELSTMSDMFYEKQPSNLHPGIQIRSLRKEFGKKVAVNDLFLDIYDDQITALLGHNGAGKTSTMSMLTGIIPPTSGTAIIHGFDIRTDMKHIRADLGLCPQFNILFDDLTVKEHLYFFSRLKGLRKRKVDEEIDKYVNLLELQDKVDKKSSSLSGGMKRKLCVGIALCGNSKVVMLDEPTAGMDPSSRRALWDLLREQKKGRCVLLTTHYMDEADLLGDRIAIMAEGELKCCGSSYFLKKKFGAGYHLILDKLPSCDPKQVTALLEKYIPDVQIFGNAASELTYLLSEEYVASFETMLRDLEQHIHSLGIRSYGISLTTLEDVFLRVGIEPKSTNLFGKQVFEQTRSFRSTNSSMTAKASVRSKNDKLLTGPKLIKNQFMAMLMKKYLSIARTWLLQIIQILIPVAFLIIAIIASRNMNKYTVESLPKLPLSLDIYEDPIILVQDDVSNRFSEHFLQIVQGHQVQKVTSIEEAMLNLTKIVPDTVARRYLVGASFTLNERNGTVFTAWFNNDPYHTPGLALALILNTMYGSLLGGTHSIAFANHPLPFTTDTQIDRLLKGNGLGFQLAFNIAFSMSFVASFYILFYIKERVCKSKHLQFASGAKGYIFWTVAFLGDLTTFIVTILALLLTMLAFQEEGFRSTSELGRIFLLLFCFGVAMLPVMYLAAFLFDIPSTGYSRMTLFNVFMGVTAFLVIQILGTPGLKLEYVADSLHWGFLVIPHYSLATGIRDSYVSFTTTKMCNFFVNSCLERNPNRTVDDCWFLACHSNTSQVLSQYCCEREPDYFKWESPGVGRNMLYSLICGAALFLLLILIEFNIFSKVTKRLPCGRTTKEFEDVSEEDEDVRREKEKIRTTAESELCQQHILVLKNITKYYKSFLAVNGVNGAGKTSTFKMITGDVKITQGDAWIRGFDIKTHLHEVQKLIGYCPQFDALIPELTPKETLIIFALLRGVPFSECTRVSEKLSYDFDFHRHLNKRVQQLSGGNRRKLSTAISLIGDPPLICLDEPTAGMDPATKRNLWDSICTIRDKGKSIVFTSHSMEECEALCTRLAIMVNGNFKCLGSVQHLKNKFAAGYTLTIKLKGGPEKGPSQTEFERVEKFVSTNFSSAKLQEKHHELLIYYISDQSVKWSKMFGILERGKHRLNIEGYSLGQASLEQIFLTLTRFQH